MQGKGDWGTILSDCQAGEIRVGLDQFPLGVNGRLPEEGGGLEKESVKGLGMGVGSVLGQRVRVCWQEQREA